MKYRLKWFFQILMAAVLGLSLLGSAVPVAFGQPGFAGGSGTPDDPYLVASPAQLNNVRNDLQAHYKQIADIDLSGYAAQDGWRPIGTDPGPSHFTGSYDGGGHTISNLTINRPDRSDQGLFGVISLKTAEIKNLHLENINVTGSEDTGGLLGRGVTAFNIENVTVTGQVKSTGNNIGGVAGRILGGTIHNASFFGVVQGAENTGGLVGYSRGEIRHAYALGSVAGTNQVGGLVGWNSTGVVADSYSRATVTGEESVGGLVGRMGIVPVLATSSLVRSFSTGSVTGTGVHVGGLVGEAQGLLREIHNYWDTVSSGQSSSALGQGHPTEKMHIQSTYQFFNFLTLWTMDTITGYPVFQDLSRYQLPQQVDVTSLPGSGSVEDPYLIRTADELNAVRQDLEAHYRLVNNIDLSSTVIWNYGRGWEPIGEQLPFFLGSFDGGGHAIYNLAVTTGGRVGLFGTIENGAIVKNLRLENVNVFGGGGLLGIGGLLAIIENVSVTGKVLSIDNNVGGLAGWLKSGVIHYASFIGDVQGANNVGGLVGYSRGEIRHAYSLGLVQGTNQVGGLVGAGEGRLIDTYSRASVTGEQNVGGLVGRIDTSIFRSFSAGPVTGTDENVGGLVGMAAESVKAFYSFWDMETSGQPTSILGEGQTTEKMHTQSTFEFFNFFTLWTMDPITGYPVFQDLSRYQQPQHVDVTSLDGSGAPDDPYLIRNANELNAVRQDLTAHYELVNDIDLSSTVIWDYGQGWEPIGQVIQDYDDSFVFDGGGRTIRNMAISRGTSYNNIGLFGFIDNGVLKNLHMEEVSVLGLTTSASTGGLLGRGWRSIIENVSVTGHVFGLGDEVGGVAGTFNQTSIGQNITGVYAVVDVHGRDSVGGVLGTTDSDSDHLFSLGSVIGSDKVGGLIGNLYKATLAHSFSRASVSGENEVGGLLGYVDVDSQASEPDPEPDVRYVYSTGFVSDTGVNVGGLVGRDKDNNLEVAGAYWDVETSGQDTSAGGLGYTTDQMTVDDAMGFDYFATWSRSDDINDGYPYLQDPAMVLVNIICDVLPAGGGTLTGCGPQPFGKTVTLVATPAAGYIFDAWMENGQIVSTDPRLTLIATGDRSFRAVFQEMSESMKTSASIPVNGGSLFSEIDQTQYDFFAGSFGSPVVFTHTHRPGQPPDIPAGLSSIGYYFTVEALDQATNAAAQLVGTVGLRIDFGKTAYGQNITKPLSLWRFDGSGWVRVPSAVIGDHTLLAYVDQFSKLAIFEGTPEITTQAPKITSAASATLMVETPSTFTMAATGVPVPGLTVSGILPEGVVFADYGNGTAVLMGTPFAGSGGVYNLTITARNLISPEAVQVFTLYVVREGTQIFLPLIVSD